MIQCKRVYEPASPADGRRVLVDRLWPRGIRKDAALLRRPPLLRNIAYQMRYTWPVCAPSTLRA